VKDRAAIKILRIFSVGATKQPKTMGFGWIRENLRLEEFLVTLL
jgi:hypothetical protein